MESQPGNEPAEPGVGAESVGQNTSVSSCEYWGYGRFGAWRARFWAGKRKFVDFSLDRKVAMVYTGGSGGEREFHRNNKLGWRGFYLRACFSAVEVFAADERIVSRRKRFFSPYVCVTPWPSEFRAAIFLRQPVGGSLRPGVKARVLNS